MDRSAVSHAVVEVGPSRVRGPTCLEQELVSVALDAIDDDLALLGERAVSVPELWAELMCAAAGGADAVVLVCPTWWPSARIDRVRAAAEQAARAVEVLGRTAVLQNDSRATVVEIGPELIVVTRVGARAVVIADHDGDVAEEVTAAVGLAGPVLIDAPAYMYAGRSVDEIVKRLCRSGISARLIDEVAVRRAAARQVPPSDVAPGQDGRRRRRTAVTAGVVVTTVTVCGGLGLRGGGAEPPVTPTSLLVEGRVEMLVPAAWPVQRITSGPGSARVEVVSPSDDDVRLHLTQSVGPPETDHARTAASLRAALAEEPGDVFVDFDASASPAGRVAVSYRELRPDRHVAWTVLVDGRVRIAIGCQSAPGRESAVRDVCDQAIRSARAIA
ncbi:type VII secretion-associated protein [Mycolicibacterium celeriflavum]|nr:type VII secretion-associated protein [Mycolicibacterium celeriflavum]